MFDKFKAMGALASLMRDKESLREGGERVREHAERLRAIGQAGGGAVRVTANGKMTILDVELSPAILAGLQDESSRAYAQDLIAQAANAAIKSAQESMQSAIREEAERMGLGDLASDLSRFIS